MKYHLLIMLLTAALATAGCGEAPTVEGAVGAGANVEKGDRGDDEAGPFEDALDVLRQVAESGDNALQRDLARRTVSALRRVT